MVMKYETYHETFHSVIESLTEAVAKAGIISEEFANRMYTGGINYGGNASFSFSIDSLKGRNTRKGLHFQVWRLESGRYELNAYVL